MSRTGPQTTAMAVRVAEYLRRRYPSRTVKSVALELNVSNKTVEKWLFEEKPPSQENLIEMKIAYGWDFIEYIYGKHLEE